MAHITREILKEAPTFYAQVRDAFHFLEGDLGFRVDHEHLTDIDDLRDTTAQIGYVKDNLAIRVRWYFADTAIAVGFLETKEPGIFPSKADAFGKNPLAARLMTLESIARLAGQADDPDFLMAGMPSGSDKSLKKRADFLQAHMGEVLAGLARATQRYAMPLLESDLALFDEIVPHVAQESADQRTAWREKRLKNQARNQQG